MSIRHATIGRTNTRDWTSVLDYNRQSRASVAYLSYFQSGESRSRLSSADVLTDREEVVFPTGSRFTGEWDHLGNMSGVGIYMMPHNVEYDGDFLDGQFDGDGVLTYPSGAQIFGRWKKGVLQKIQHKLHDSLKYSPKKWKYCEFPDRRFNIENKDGLQPAGRSNKTQRLPARLIPEGCYDTGDGFYNPRTRCVTSPDGKILRIPTARDSAWIEANCRRAWDENVGYRPELFYQSATAHPTSLAHQAAEGGFTEVPRFTQGSGILKRGDSVQEEDPYETSVQFADSASAPSLFASSRKKSSGQDGVLRTSGGKLKHSVQYADNLSSSSMPSLLSSSTYNSSRGSNFSTGEESKPPVLFTSGQPAVQGSLASTKVPEIREKESTNAVPDAQVKRKSQGLRFTDESSPS